MKFQAALFDMDGTLINSEPYWLVAERALMSRFGHTWTDLDQAHCIGGPLPKVGAYMSELANHAEDPLYFEVELVRMVAEIATKNVEEYFKGKPDNWTLTLGSVQDKPRDVKYDRIVLDMLAPWECIQLADDVLHPGGVLLAYVATTTQLSAMAEAIKESGRFTEPESSESLIRPWHHEGLAVRPVHRMIGHTGFLIQARRLAPGVTAPLRRRRPSKGAYGLPEEESAS